MTHTKDVMQKEPCGCVGLGYAVNFCPLHAAAPELLEACRELVRSIEAGEGEGDSFDMAEHAIAKAESTP
ncbi:hypothetical protein LCGC14_3021400 [marine sediment metagenome]|uniref:Uncharacterized protein n=1 Tax=marine sediment metagenome TaxID=412755 RepID=A0A0F8WV71_9ZZZZ